MDRLAQIHDALIMISRGKEPSIILERAQALKRQTEPQKPLLLAGTSLPSATLPAPAVNPQQSVQPKHTTDQGSQSTHQQLHQDAPGPSPSALQIALPGLLSSAPIGTTLDQPSLQGPEIQQQGTDQATGREALVTPEAVQPHSEAQAVVDGKIPVPLTGQTPGSAGAQNEEEGTADLEILVGESCNALPSRLRLNAESDSSIHSLSHQKLRLCSSCLQLYHDNNQPM